MFAVDAEKSIIETSSINVGGLETNLENQDKSLEKEFREKLQEQETALNEKFKKELEEQGQFLEEKFRNELQRQLAKQQLALDSRIEQQRTFETKMKRMMENMTTNPQA
ncbi:hypothetical protein BGZ51_002577 [Haplosporangium sp. Z 767]|nr:hypothetical protein BGZ50_007834 [Haplosporangium sp. Z 11]KAF9193630.1 hypothetical protein BGZ51_002577 [Haplosporangium sp. Z 767]